MVKYQINLDLLPYTTSEHMVTYKIVWLVYGFYEKDVYEIPN